MRLARRETVLLAATLGAGLFAGSVIVAKPRIEELKALRLEYGRVMKEAEHDRLLVENREGLARQFEELSQRLPRYPAGRELEIHFLSVMDSLAAKHGVKIAKRQAGDERALGAVFELPIECRDWEGSLESLVRFLFDLQTEGAMFDVRQLLVKSKGQGPLKGRFVLYCAYTREQGGEAK